MADYIRLEQEIDSIADLIWDVASHVWEYAEVGYKEYKSSAYVCEALESQGAQCPSCNGDFPCGCQHAA